MNGFKVGVRNVVTLLALLALLPPIGAWFGAWWWPLELLVHFHGCYALVLAPTAAVLMLLGGRRTAAVVALVAAIDVMFVVPLWFGGEHIDGVTAELRVLCSNVATHNRDRASVFELIEAERPDIVALIEVDDAWLATAARRLDVTYPHRLAEPRSDNFGIAFWSRLPCTKLAIHRLDFTAVPSIEAIVETASGPCTVFVTHPIPPTWSRAPTARDEHLQNLARFAKASDGPLVIIGDLNTSSWTRSFAELLRVGGLHDGRHGFGPQPTWPGRLARIGITIDHVLVNSALTVQDHRVGPYVGSDHRPLMVTLGVRD